MNPDSTPLIGFWLDRLRAGDPSARNELIRHSRDRLRLLTHQMMARHFSRLRGWEDTSDVLQNVLIRLDRALQAIELPSPRDFLRLANTHIRRELLDVSRRIFGPEGPGRHLLPPGGGGLNDTPNQPRDPAADQDRLDCRLDFHSRIESLGEEDQELFGLIYYQGLTQADAAALLGVPLRTLRRRWQAARLRLMAGPGEDVPS